MSYPNFPNNRLIVGGVDLTTEYLLILADGYTLEPPEPKTYVIDVPGGNGNIDLTDALFGDTAYKNRKQEFTFYVIATENFEKVKTEVTNFLHGKSFDYQITMDPEYTYHGRFTVSGSNHETYSIGIVGVISISIDAAPYKTKGMKVYKLNATGGSVYRFESGRKRVQPTFECSNPTIVGFKGEEFTLPQGSYKCPGVWFDEGWNEVYLNSRVIETLTWDELEAREMMWNEIEAHRWFDLSRLDTPGTDLTGLTWDQIAEYRWDDLATKTWDDISYVDAGGRNYTTYVSYEWGDL